MPSNTVLISGPAVGAAQIPVWSFSSVFLPPVCTAVRTSAFSSVAAPNGLSYAPWTQSAWLIVWIPSAACTAGGEVWGLLPWPHCPWVPIEALFPPLHVGRLLGFAPEPALEDLGLPL